MTNIDEWANMTPRETQGISEHLAKFGIQAENGTLDEVEFLEYLLSFEDKKKMLATLIIWDKWYYGKILDDVFDRSTPPIPKEAMAIR